MTDKVQKIRKEVERLQNELIQEKKKGFGSDTDDACILELQNVLTYIDSLQEEPVSIWHDGCEIPKSETNILMIRKDEKDSNYPPIAGCFHGLNSRIDGKNWGYYNGFCYNEIEAPYKWAYVDDFLALEEIPPKFPLISQKKCMYTKDNFTDEDRKVLCDDCKEKCEYNKEEEPVSDECIYNRTLEERQKSCKFCSAACQVRIKEEPVSEDLEEEIDNYVKRNGYDGLDSIEEVKYIANHFAKWQKQQDQKTKRIKL